MKTTYLMCNEDNIISEWNLDSYKLQLSYKNPDEYTRMHLNIKQKKTFYEIIFKFSSKNESEHSIDIELDFHGGYFRLNNHWDCTTNSLKFTRKKDFNDFRKKLDELNIKVKERFENYYKNKEDIKHYYDDYLYQVGEDLKELCKGDYLKKFDLNKKINL